MIHLVYMNYIRCQKSVTWLHTAFRIMKENTVYEHKKKGEEEAAP